MIGATNTKVNQRHIYRWKVQTVAIKVPASKDHGKWKQNHCQQKSEEVGHTFAGTCQRRDCGSGGDHGGGRKGGLWKTIVQQCQFH